MTYPIVASMQIKLLSKRVVQLLKITDITVNELQNLTKNKRIFVFGAGAICSTLFQHLPLLSEKVLFLSDNDKNKQNKYCYYKRKIKVISPEALSKKITHDDILIIASKYETEILKQLSGLITGVTCYSASRLNQQFETKLFEAEMLKELQSTELEILKEFSRICNKHNLKYYLGGGTLLGAVRHGGFIPWDDDLDVLMPRSDFEKFAKLYYKELDSKYFFHFINTDKTYWLPFAKIRKNNTLFNEKNIASVSAHKGIYIDIFPLDDTPVQESAKNQKRNKLLNDLNSSILAKRNIDVLLPINVWFYLPLRLTVKIRQYLMKNRNSDKNPFYINWGSNYNFVIQTIPKSVYGEGVKISFSDEDFIVPSDYEYVLKRIYGNDFMTLPPKEKRITHSPLEIKFNDY